MRGEWSIIVDRVIFSLVNRCEIRSSDHFVKVEQDGVYLNAEGKNDFCEGIGEQTGTEANNEK